MFILESEQYRNNLINTANTSNLPVSMVYFITKDFFNEIERIYIQSLNNAKNMPTQQEGSIDVYIDADGETTVVESQNNNEEE